MSDVSTLWNTSYGDWSLAGADLASGNDIVSAVLISLFTDRLAGSDDALPDGTPDRRGWWGDVSNNLIGSRLWLLARAKHTQATLGLAEAYIAEALQWLIDDGLASKIDVHAEWQRSDTLGALITVYAARSGRPLVRIGAQNVYAVPSVQAWGWNAAQAVGQWEPLNVGSVTHRYPLRLDGTWRLDGSQILDGIKR